MATRRTPQATALRGRSVPPRRCAARLAGILAAVSCGCLPVSAWPQAARSPADSDATSAQRQAPFDLQGYWVSMITQNWQFRMIVPGPGEYADIPINRQAKQFADVWKAETAEAAGQQCAAYGAAVIMRLPERLHIHWQDANLLLVQTDSGMQTRSLHFGSTEAPAGEPASLQGYSQARWVKLANSRQQFAPPRLPPSPHAGSLEINTDHLQPGLLRKNGVPYGSHTQVHEWWDLRTEPGGQQWLSISTRVVDPEFLLDPYIYDSIFAREADAAKWHPTPCSLRY